MQFPDPLIVEVQSAATGDPIPNILVWVNLTVWGQDYYRALVGLTDGVGLARLSRAALRDAYRVDQQMFPMDYKLALHECEDLIVVGVEGGAPFALHRDTGFEGGLVRSEFRKQWQQAQNEHWSSAQVRVELTPHGAPLRLQLALSPQP